uniref:RING-type E3 ubiquitin transferase n=1 Tax=Heterorhabditis bacteriophora TaxID=37862 RepID=A0A1I7WQI4_HETBA
MALLRGNKECPTCRKKLVSKRSLRPDPNFDSLIAKIWPDRKTYEDLQSVASEKFAAQTNMDALRNSIVEGMKAQEVNRRKRFEKRRRKREEEGGIGPDDQNIDNGSNSPPEEDVALDGMMPLSLSLPMSSIVNPSCSASVTNEFPEEEEIMDDLDLMTEVIIVVGLLCSVLEELQAELDDLEEVELDENDSELDIEIRSDDDSLFNFCRHDETVTHQQVMTPLTSYQPQYSVTIQPPEQRTNLAQNIFTPSQEVSVQPPASVLHPKDRLSRWLDENPSSPQIPEENMNDPLERRTDDSDMLDPPMSGADEIEAELLPSAALLRRECPPELLIPRYLRTKHDTTISFLFCMIFSRNDGHHIRKIFLHETMLTAQSAMTRDDHLVIFFDTQAPQLCEEKSSVLEDVVPAHFLSLPHV